MLATHRDAEVFGSSPPPEIVISCQIIENERNKKNKKLDSLIANRNRLGTHSDNENVKSKTVTTSWLRQKCDLKTVINIGCTIVIFGLLLFVLTDFYSFKQDVTELENEVSTLQSYINEQSNKSKICLFCDEISQGPFKDDNPGFSELIQKLENDTMLCCAETTKQMSVLLNLFAKRKLLEKCVQDTQSSSTSICNTTAQNSSLTPTFPPSLRSNISIHLVANQEKLSSGGATGESIPIRGWTSDGPGSHITGIRTIGQGDTYDKLVISATGVYYVYCQVGYLIHYEDQMDDSVTSGAMSLFLTVMRYNVIYPTGSQTLLKSGVTKCWEKQKDYGRYSNYVGGAVELNKGDQIYATVSNISIVSTAPGLTYFGMFRLG